jgi:predicted HNH restriction endonuclease
MSEFWGYAGADILAVLVIASLSLTCLVCARLFVKNYGD